VTPSLTNFPRFKLFISFPCIHQLQRKSKLVPSPWGTTAFANLSKLKQLNPKTMNTKRFFASMVKNLTKLLQSWLKLSWFCKSCTYENQPTCVVDIWHSNPTTQMWKWMKLMLWILWTLECSGFELSCLSL
jgi:hypothetical protein